MKNSTLISVTFLTISIILQAYELVGDGKYLKHGISILLCGTVIFLSLWAGMRKPA